MSVEWTHDMSVEVSEIDDQHRELFKRASDLIEAVSSNKELAEIERMVAFYQNHLSAHFQTEEKYMIRYGDPLYISHKAQHTLYLMKITGIKQSLAHCNLDTCIKIVRDAVVDWLKDHIDQADKPMASFINSARYKKAA